MPIQISLSNAIGALQGLVGGGPGPGPNPPYTPPLDTYPAAAAYSVRLLNSSYSGPCVEAYRFSDGATQDIGFDANGLINEADILSFDDGGGVGVSIWYDQSGNGLDAPTNVAATASNVMRISDGSTVDKNGEFIGLYNPTANSGKTHYTATLGASTSGPHTLFVVNASMGTGAGFPNNLIGINRAGAYLLYQQTRDSLYLQSSPSYTTAIYNGTDSEFGNRHVGYYMFDAANSQIATDGRDSVSANLSARTFSELQINGADSAGNSASNYLFEWIFYNENFANRTALESNINNYYQISNFPDYTSGFLADYPDAEVAYSVRKLSNTAIKCMRVRRDVPPYDEQDIGFTPGGDLDESAIVAFGGSDVLVVSKWYDQSGQSRHLGQINPNLQPQIYNGTAVITENGKPAVEFVSDYLGTAPFGADIPQPTTYFITVNKTNHNGYLFERSGTGGRQSQGDGNWLFAGSVAFGFYPPADLGSRKLFTALFDGANSISRMNGIGTGSGNPGISGQGGISIGRVNQTLTGKVQEFVMYGLNQAMKFADIETNTNLYYGIYTMYNYEPATSGFLFDYPGADAAYSVRQLNNNATVSMRVRRAVAPFDEQDIGFTPGGDLDEAAIVAFGGSDVLVVSKWYDQSSNQRHLGQINPNSQPLIYNGVTVIADNGNPAIAFDGSDDHFPWTETNYNINNLSSFSVGRANSNAATGSGDILISLSGGSASRWYTPYVVGTTTRFGYATTSNAANTTFDTDQHLFTMIAGATQNNMSAFLDGSLLGTATRASGFDNSNTLAIGSYNGTIHAWSGKIQESIIYFDDKYSSRAAIDSDIKTYFSIP